MLGAPGDLDAELRLGLLQLTDPGAVGVARLFADAVGQLVPQLALHLLGLHVELGQLDEGAGGEEDIVPILCQIHFRVVFHQ